MYSPEIISRREHNLRKSGVKFTRLPKERSIEIADKINRLRYDSSNRLLPDQQLSRPLDDREIEFTMSELVLCKIDFRYFFERYYKLEIDPGVMTGESSNGASPFDAGKKIAAPVLLPSQERFIRKAGEREEVCYQEYAKYKFTRGILLVFHKVRQVAATATACGMKFHRMIFWPGTRALCASIDEKRVAELYRRDDLALDEFPFWMCPRVYPRVKNEEIGFASPINSRCVYQAENQQAGGLGVGTQQDFSHLTEVGLWNNPGYIKFSLLPAIPKAITTLLIMESTSNGKGNYWHDLTEDVRHKREGYEDWTYAFIPWYVNATKYRGNVPVNWKPKEHTLKHAEMIIKTSPEFNYGVTIRPTKEQLYWWEKERAAHLRSGELASFLTNFPATPEQSFQSPNNGAFSPEFIERVEVGVSFPEGSYEFDLVGADNT